MTDRVSDVKRTVKRRLLGWLGMSQCPQCHGWWDRTHLCRRDGRTVYYLRGRSEISESTFWGPA